MEGETLGETEGDVEEEGAGLTAIVIAYQRPESQLVQEAGASVPLQFNL
jgi:hypothetical protein